MVLYRLYHFKVHAVLQGTALWSRLCPKITFHHSTVNCTAFRICWQFFIYRHWRFIKRCWVRTFVWTQRGGPRCRRGQRPQAIWLLLCRNFNKKSFEDFQDMHCLLASWQNFSLAKFHLWSSQSFIWVFSVLVSVAGFGFQVKFN